MFNFFKNRPSVTSKYFWKDSWYDLCCFFFPQNRWATKAIPRRYSDKPELIRDFLFAALVDYVEVEQGEEFLNDPLYASDENMPEQQQIYDQEARDLYWLIKGLPARFAANNKAWDLATQEPFEGDLLDKINCPEYQKTVRPFIEEIYKIAETEKEICERIVKIRGHFWT